MLDISIDLSCFHRKNVKKVLFICIFQLFLFLTNGFCWSKNIRAEATPEAHYHPITEVIQYGTKSSVCGDCAA